MLLWMRIGTHPRVDPRIALAVELGPRIGAARPPSRLLEALEGVKRDRDLRPDPIFPAVDLSTMSGRVAGRSEGRTGRYREKPTQVSLTTPSASGGSSPA